MPNDYRSWRIEHGLTTHIQSPSGTGVISTEELLVTAGLLIAALAIVPLPWAIAAFYVAALPFHLWLHSHDRCAGGCGKPPPDNADDPGEQP